MVDEEIPPLTPQVVAAAMDEGEAPTTSELAPPPEAPPRRPWGLLAGVAIGLVAIWFLFGIVLGGGNEAASPTTESTTTAAVSSTTTEAVTTTTAEASTTIAETTTSSTTTTTTSTTTTTTLPPIEAVGDAIPITDLTLGAFALGPFTFTDEVPALGRLVASLGQPDAMAAAGTDMGMCEGESGVAYTWDGFTAIFRGEGENAGLVGYRLDSTGGDEPAQTITTRSGLALGHTVEKLEAIYLQSAIAYENIDGSPHFILLRSTDNATLLWGPVTSSDPAGIVEGIYSPRPCDRGPAATP